MKALVGKILRFADDKRYPEVWRQEVYDIQQNLGNQTACLKKYLKNSDVHHCKTAFVRDKTVSWTIFELVLAVILNIVRNMWLQAREPTDYRDLSQRILIEIEKTRVMAFKRPRKLHTVFVLHFWSSFGNPTQKKKLILPF